MNVNISLVNIVMKFQNKTSFFHAKKYDKTEISKNSEK